MVNLHKDSANTRTQKNKGGTDDTSAVPSVLNMCLNLSTGAFHFTPRKRRGCRYRRRSRYLELSAKKPQHTTRTLLCFVSYSQALLSYSSVGYNLRELDRPDPDDHSTAANCLRNGIVPQRLFEGCLTAQSPTVRLMMRV